MLLLGLPLVLPMLLRKAVYVVGVSLALYLLAPSEPGGTGKRGVVSTRWPGSSCYPGGCCGLHGQQDKAHKPGRYPVSLWYVGAAAYLLITGYWRCHGNGRSSTAQYAALTGASSIVGSKPSPV